MNKLSKFKDIVNKIQDPEILKGVESMLKDMLSIENMKEKIEMLEKDLSTGDRAVFWFLLAGLEKEQINLASNTVVGRKRVITDKIKKDKVKKESEKS